METVIVFPNIPFDPDDLIKVSSFLTRSGAVVPAYIPPVAGHLSPISILTEQHIHGLKFVLTLDRNLAGRMGRVARDGYSPGSPHPEQLAAHLMAFAQCLDIQIEPSIAFHELAHSQGNKIAQEELAVFRAANQNNAGAWVDVALGRRKDLTALMQPELPTKEDLAFPLRRWNRNYIVIMKMAELELDDSLENIEKMRALLAWMYNSFIAAGPASQFAVMYFSPFASRRGMVKALRSEDRERAISGLRNAAWDVTHLSDLVERQQTSDQEMTRYMFATADSALASVAPKLFLGPDQASSLPPLRLAIQDWWGEDADEVSEMVFDLFARTKENPNRPRPEAGPGGDFIADSVKTGEDRIRSWKPGK